MLKLPTSKARFPRRSAAPPPPPSSVAAAVAAGAAGGASGGVLPARRTQLPSQHSPLAAPMQSLPEVRVTRAAGGLTGGGGGGSSGGGGAADAGADGSAPPCYGRAASRSLDAMLGGSGRSLVLDASEAPGGHSHT